MQTELPTSKTGLDLILYTDNFTGTFSHSPLTIIGVEQKNNQSVSSHDHDDEFPPRQKKRIDLQQNKEARKKSTTNSTTIQALPLDLLRICQSFLGVGHFRYGPLACKMLLKAYQDSVSDEKITTAERVTASISCAKKYMQELVTTSLGSSSGRTRQNIAVWKLWNGRINKDTQAWVPGISMCRPLLPVTGSLMS